MFGDSDHDFFAEKIGASELDVIIKESIDANESIDDWVKRLSRYHEINDLDARRRAENLYNKYIK
jgi:hypothetical protein